MNKILVSSLVALIALGANTASAQSYYPTSPYTQGYGGTQYNYGATYQQPYAGACVNLMSDLSYGSRGSQVLQLQTFLVSRNYPGGGNWMITGNFRTATLAAVRNFQMEQGLGTTGVVDAATRAAIARVSCLSAEAGGGAGYNYNVSPYTYSMLSTYNYNNNNNYNYNTNCYYTYPYTCNTYNYNTFTLSSLSPVSGERGTILTIYGSNFDYSNNTVYFGSQPVANITSSNGTSLTVTVPWTLNPGGVGVYVTNSRGTSNTLTFNVIASYSGCNYPYTYGSYNYNSIYCPPYSGNPVLTYLSPNFGAVGTSVTVVGSGFSPTGNTVHFSGGVITGLSSSDGRSLSFIVPSQLGYSSQVVTLGTYNVSVSTFGGQTSNVLPFTVTGVGSLGAPTIASVNGPTSLAVGTVGTWTITINNQNNTYMTTSVRWGDEGAYSSYASAPQTTYVSGTNTLTFTHTYYTPGTYNVIFTVSNNAGQQNTASASVVVGSPTYGNVSLSYLTPMSGRVGTQVLLQGSGFSALDNTVHFGIGGTQHVPSQNSMTIYYTIPYAISPCDLVGPGCAAPTSLVAPGSYPIYVTNNQGTSQTLQFQVQ